MSESAAPRYRQIAEHLRALVDDGDPGDRLPSDAELCARFGVSRMTARQAVDLLLAEHLVVRHRGQGTFVAERPVPRLLGSPISFTASMRRRGREVASRLLAAGLMAPEPEDAVALRLAEDADVVVVERLRIADGVPMAIERAALVPELAALLERDLAVGSLHTAMEELGHRPTTSHAQVTARLADARERRLLGLDEAGVLLCERRVIEDQDGVPVEHTETRYAAERYVFEVVEHRDGGQLTVRYLGLDLGGTNIKGVVVDVGAAGPPVALAQAMVPTGGAEGPDAVTERIVGLGRELVDGSGDVLGVGLCVPGLFDPFTGVVEFFTNLPGPWPGFPLRDRLAEGLGVPGLIMNDGRAFTLAEGRMGAGQGCDTLVGITLGTGVGGGVLVDGRLHRGRWGIGGEIGHLLVVDDDDAAPCGCGARGCLEAYLRADVISARAGRATAEEVYAGARAGDPSCVAAVAEVCRHLSAALAGLLMVLGPDRIVVGGGIAAAGETLLAPLRTEVARRIQLLPAGEIEIVPAVLGSYAGAMGAAIAAADAAA